MESRSRNASFAGVHHYVNTRESGIRANCVEEARFVSMAGKDGFANFVEGSRFVHTTVKSISVSSVKDQLSVCMGK
jgi:hypothetical protein